MPSTVGGMPGSSREGRRIVARDAAGAIAPDAAGAIARDDAGAIAREAAGAFVIDVGARGDEEPAARSSSRSSVTSKVSASGGGVAGGVLLAWRQRAAAGQSLCQFARVDFIKSLLSKACNSGNYTMT